MTSHTYGLYEFIWPLRLENWSKIDIFIHGYLLFFSFLATSGIAYSLSCFWRSTLLPWHFQSSSPRHSFPCVFPSRRITHCFSVFGYAHLLLSAFGFSMSTHSLIQFSFCVLFPGASNLYRPGTHLHSFVSSQYPLPLHLHTFGSSSSIFLSALVLFLFYSCCFTVEYTFCMCCPCICS